MHLTQQVAQVLVGLGTDLHSRAQPKQFPKLPHYVVSCLEDCDLAVIIGGNPPLDMYASVTGKFTQSLVYYRGLTRGSVAASDDSGVGNLSLDEMQPESTECVTLQSARGPFTIRTHTTTSPGSMPEFYLDFQSSKEIVVELVGPDDGEQLTV